MNDFSKMNTGERLKYLRVIRDNNSSGHNLYFKLDGRPKDAEKNKDQNYPRQAIYRMEKNLAALPLDFATKYSKYFNVSFDFLYCNSDDINVGYDDVKKKLGLSDFALNKLEYMKNSEKEKKRKMEKFKKSWEFHGRTLTVENGEIAKQAGGSVVVRYDDTVVLSVATASNQAKDTEFINFEQTHSCQNHRHNKCNCS